MTPAIAHDAAVLGQTVDRHPTPPRQTAWIASSPRLAPGGLYVNYWTARGCPCQSSGVGNRAQQGLRSEVSSERPEGRMPAGSVRRDGTGNPEPPPSVACKRQPTKNHAPHGFWPCGAGEENSGDTYSRALGTTIGSGSLTTVFGMGTGVTFQIWSPERSSRRIRGEGSCCRVRGEGRGNWHDVSRYRERHSVCCFPGPKPVEHWIRVVKHSSVSTG